MAMRLFGHPLHPATVHAPLALLMVLPIWDALGWFQPEGAWWSVAYWSGVAGLVLALPAFITGFIDFLAVPPAVVRLAIAHVMTMGAVVMTFLISILAFHGRIALPYAAHPLAALITDAIAAGCLLIGGWLGGQLVYGHGVGVRRRATDAPSEGGTSA